MQDMFLSTRDLRVREMSRWLLDVREPLHATLRHLHCRWASSASPHISGCPHSSRMIKGQAYCTLTPSQACCVQQKHGFLLLQNMRTSCPFQACGALCNAVGVSSSLCGMVDDAVLFSIHAMPHVPPLTAKHSC